MKQLSVIGILYAYTFTDCMYASIWGKLIYNVEKIISNDFFINKRCCVIQCDIHDGTITVTGDSKGQLKRNM